MSSADLAVVGAGPYGLSLAAHARRAGLEVAVLGRPLATWDDQVPAGTQLETEAWTANLSDPDGRLSLAAYCAQVAPDAGYRDVGWPVPAELWRNYAEWFRERAGVEVAGANVCAVRQEGEVLAVTLDDGARLQAATVAVALGMTAFPWVPPPLDALPAPEAVHGSAVSDPDLYAGCRVAVVGGGQSALELSALLAEAGARVTLVARAAALRWHGRATPDRTFTQRLRVPRSALGDGWVGMVVCHGGQAIRLLPPRLRATADARLFFPAGAWWLRDRVEGHVEIRCLRSVTEASCGPGGVLLRLAGPDGPEELFVDRVVTATGYEPDLSKIPFLAGIALHIVAGTKSPRLSPAFESSVAGLCFTGALASATFGPAQRFLAGIPLAVRSVTRTARRRSAAATPPPRALRCQYEQSARTWPAPAAAARAGLLVARRRWGRRSTPDGVGTLSKFAAGDLVRVLDREGISRTLDARFSTRGLLFTDSQWAFCGRTMVVDRVVTRMLDDRGVLRPISRAVILAGATCDAGGAGCGRSCALIWKDEWLEADGGTGDPEAGWRTANPGQSVRVRPPHDVGLKVGRSRRIGELALPLDAQRFAGRSFRVERRIEMPALRGVAPGGDWYLLEGTRCSGRELGHCDRRCALAWHGSWLEW